MRECTKKLNLDAQVNLLVRSEETQQDICLLFVKQISATYLKRAKSTEVTLAVQALAMEDRLQQWGESFRLLATSEPSAEHRFLPTTIEMQLAAGDQHTDLIHVVYEGINPAAPHYASVNHRVQFKFNRLHIICNRETIVTLIDCIKKIASALKTDQPPSTTTATSTVEEEDDWTKLERQTPEEAEDLARREQITTFLLEADFKDFGLTLNQGGSVLAIFNFHNSSALLAVRSWYVA